MLSNNLSRFMAELRIQPKKSAPSPWLLVLLAALVLAAGAYFFLRSGPADERAAPSPAALPTVPADSLAADSASSTARATVPADPDTAAAVSPATAPADSRAALLALSPALTGLADAPNLRDDVQVREQRDNFTSATNLLQQNDPNASLRPGLVAAANLLLAMQQKAYPALEDQANDLVRQAGNLTGRNTTPAEQAQNYQYVQQAAALLKQMTSQTEGAHQ